jgi:tRNA G18 (ribose-2'-O)-methylase SpoU
MRMRGYFGIGVFHSKTEENIGTLWRTAQSMGASYIYTIGRRYTQQKTDTARVPRHIPLFHYSDLDEFRSGQPKGTSIIGIEIDPRGRRLTSFVHPEQAVYVLGAEGSGLDEAAMSICDHIVQIPGKTCLNVAVAGSIVLYDRMMKMEKR